MSQQLTLADAIAAGDRGMSLCVARAERSDPLFSERAAAAMLEHLRLVGQCSGEVLTDVARAKGAVPINGDRAFGAVFKSLARRGVIRCVGYCLRTKGHGTSGGRLWAIAQ
jgi:hypothetical protein